MNGITVTLYHFTHTPRVCNQITLSLHPSEFNGGIEKTTTVDTLSRCTPDVCEEISVLYWIIPCSDISTCIGSYLSEREGCGGRE